jgi:site-specific recombinase XerD
MSEDKTLWDTGLFRFSREEALIAPAFRDWLSRSGSPLAHYLAEIVYGSESVEFVGTDVRKLEALIVKASATKLAALPPLRLLGKIVYQLNHALQLSIPQPTLVVRLTPPRNPFAFDDVAIAHLSVKAWLESEKCWLKELDTSDRRNVPFELLLLSSALHSGILHHDLAMGLRTAVLKPEQYIRYSDRLYVDLPLPWLGKPDQEVRRWYPDNGVACLLARLTGPVAGNTERPNLSYVLSRGQLCNKMHMNLRAELERRKVARELLPKDLADLFKRIALFLRSEIPAIMVGFATRDLTTHSLLPPSIDQVYGDPTAHAVEINESGKRELIDENDEEAYGGGNPKDLETSWLPALRRAFGVKDSTDLTKNFDELECESIVGQRMISFASSLLRRGASSGRKLAPSSTKCCVLTVARRLGPLLEERDPAQCDLECLESLYVQAIYDAAEDSQHPHKLQGTVAWALREFHCYLIRERLAKPLNDAAVFRVPRGFPSVDAVIVSVDDVFKALDYLDYEPNPSWSLKNRKTAKMEILLGFFAGLRTMEGLCAYKMHFPRKSLLPFLVLSSKKRGLKTPNAARMIPVRTFMEPFDNLIEQAEKSAYEWSHLNPNDGSSPLFENSSDNVIIPMIGCALRTVTGNKKVRYYSLRHSFASWTLTRLLISDLPEVPDLVPHLPETTKWLRQSKDFRRKLYSNDQVSNNHAWAVSTLMGHSSPDVSFANYCHTLDILLPEFLGASLGLQSVLSARDRLRLSSGQSRSTAYEHLPGNPRLSDDFNSGKRHDEAFGTEAESSVDKSAPDTNPQAAAQADRHGNVTPMSGSRSAEYRIMEQSFALKDVRSRLPNLQSEAPQRATDRGRSWIDQTWGLLYMKTQPGLNFEKIIEHLGLDLDLALMMINRNDEICSLRSAKSGKLLHTTSHTAKSDNATGSCYPRRPESGALNAARQLGERIGSFVSKEHDNAARLLVYWSQNVVPESGLVVFQERASWGDAPELIWDVKQLIREYRHFLRSLKISQQELSFVGACGKECDRVPTQWYSKWGLTRRNSCQIVNRFGKEAVRIAPGDWLAIGPQQACPDHEKYTSAYRDAFRFSMRLAAIRFGPVRSTRVKPLDRELQ